ncbi:protein of unknown function DUF4116 containing protein [Nitzschia inconspicua]|uniref:Uncharacterized protein n=1 Tax=Nitzschia inconspicua TaxID=303405 RepID=A0A9K3PZF5_9STRA|nr:protein of unknown function DUF4116 containing protein [Nitzschia inconspicua]
MIANPTNVEERIESIAVVDQNDNDALRRKIEELEAAVRSMKDVIKLSLHCSKKVCLDNLPLPLQQEILAEMESDTEKDLVLKLIREKKFTKDWYSLPEKWKHDVAIACAYFHNQPWGVKRKRNDGTLYLRSLPYSLRLNKEVILSALRASDAVLWEDVHVRFRNDTDIIAAALVTFRYKYKEFPLELAQRYEEVALYGVGYYKISADVCPCLTDQILKESIENGALAWHRLPQRLRNSTEFAMAIDIGGVRYKIGLFQALFEHCEELRHHRMFWWRWHESLFPKESDYGEENENEPEFTSLFGRFCPAELVADEHFAMKLCSGCTSIYTCIAEQPFASSRHFLETVLHRNPKVLQYLSHQTQVENVDLVLKGIRRLGELTDRSPDPSEVVTHVELGLVEELWSNYEIPMAWVKAGNGFPTCSSRADYKNWKVDRQLCLASVLASESMLGAWQFRNDIELVTQMVSKCPKLYSSAGNEAAADPVVMTITFAALPHLASETMDKLHFNGHDDKIESYLSFLNLKLEMYDTFVCCILGNMLSTQSVITTGSSLTLLNQGHETSVVYKRLLAEYLGIPTGKWLCQLLQARANVNQAIDPFDIA